jgi:hypothetical protein
MRLVVDKSRQTRSFPLFRKNLLLVKAIISVCRLHSQDARSQDLPDLGQPLLCGHRDGVWVPRSPSDPRLRRRIKLHHDIGLLRQQGE